MSESKITLMAFRPKNISTQIYQVDMPRDLLKALFALMPPKNPAGRLYTGPLEADLQSILNPTITIKPLLNDNKTPQGWLTSLLPIDAESLARVIAVWVAYTTKGSEAFDSPAHKHIRTLLRNTSIFKQNSRNVLLFDEVGAPSKSVESLAFSLFPAKAAQALVGHTMQLDDGTKLKFLWVAQSNSKGCELISEPFWYRPSKEKPENSYAIKLHLHVETIPTARQAHLAVDISVVRFITEKFKGAPYMKQKVHAYLREDTSEVYRSIEYGYKKPINSGFPIRWSKGVKEYCDTVGIIDFPAIESYLGQLPEFVRGANSVQILSPYSMQTKWAYEPSVKAGISVIDKAMFHKVLSEKLSDLADPLESLSSERMAGHDKEIFSRKKLAACTGEKKIVFQIIGSNNDELYFKCIQNKILDIFGKESIVDGVEMQVVRTYRSDNDSMLIGLAENTDGAKNARRKFIKDEFPTAENLTACIVLLQDKDFFTGKDGNGYDPKQAIRGGLASTNRLSQFLVPRVYPAEGQTYNQYSKGDGRGKENKEDPIAFAVNGAIDDLLRQLGYTSKVKENKKVHNYEPVIGLRLFKGELKGKQIALPLMVKLDPRIETVTVACALWDGYLRYWEAQLRLSQISLEWDFVKKCSKLSGNHLVRMLDSVREEARDIKTILIVQAYGTIRNKQWWPAISDTNLSSGKILRPGEEPQELDLTGTKLKIVRLRSAANGEVPDYFTDPSEEIGNSDANVKRAQRSGLFRTKGLVYALVARPYNTFYTNSYKFSKFQNPQRRFHEKTLNEYYLMAPRDDNADDELLTCARYIDSLRKVMIQCSENVVPNLPAPLHLAQKMEEYIG